MRCNSPPTKIAIIFILTGGGTAVLSNLPDNSLTAVHCHFSLEHIGDHSPTFIFDFFSELYRCCTDGALVEIKTLAPQSPLAQSDPLVQRHINSQFLEFLDTNKRQVLLQEARTAFLAQVWQDKGVNFRILKEHMHLSPDAFAKIKTLAAQAQAAQAQAAQAQAAQAQEAPEAQAQAAQTQAEPNSDTNSAKSAKAAVTFDVAALLPQLQADPNAIQAYTYQLVCVKNPDHEFALVDSSHMATQLATLAQYDPLTKEEQQAQEQKSAAGILPPGDFSPYVMRIYKLKEGRHLYVSRSIVQTGTWEPEESRLFVTLLKMYLQHQHQVNFANIGTNIGWYTLIAAKLSPHIVVDSFEPTPETQEILQQNLCLNQVNDRVTIYPIALSDSEGEAEFFINDDNDGNNSLRSFEEGKKLGAVYSSIKVPLNTLNQVYGKKPQSKWPDFVLIDTEGHEQLVFAGALELFKQGWRPFIMAEFCPAFAQLRGKCDYYHTLVKEYGYQLYIISYNNSQVPNIIATTPEDLDKQAEELLELSKTADDIPFYNILLVPEHIKASATGLAFA